jgi:hypothetical protein
MQVGGNSLGPQAAAVLEAYEAHLSKALGEQRAQNLNLSKVSIHMYRTVAISTLFSFLNRSTF